MTRLLFLLPMLPLLALGACFDGGPFALGSCNERTTR